MKKFTFKEDISFETENMPFFVNFMNIGTYKLNIVHIHHINMDTSHNST